MAWEIVFAEPNYYELQKHYFDADGKEGLAFGLFGESLSESCQQLLEHEVILVPPKHLAVQSPFALVLEDRFARSILRRADEMRLTLAEMHSHPGADRSVSFSPTDWENAREKAAWIARNIPHIGYASVVFGLRSFAAYVWDKTTGKAMPVERLKIIGQRYRCLPAQSSRPRSGWRQSLGRFIAHLRKLHEPRPGEEEWLDRQIRAFGEEGQWAISGLHVGIVGCGGTGSAVAQMLVHSGVSRFVLVDPDTVERTNLNRLWGATEADAQARLPKVEMLASELCRTNPRADITPLDVPVQSAKALNHLKRVDVLFGCTDTEGSKLVLTRLAVQYLIPFFDCGCGLAAHAEVGFRAHESGGQVRVVVPGGPCLECIDGIDREQARYDLLDARDRARADRLGYGLGSAAPAPAAMFLNMTIAALAVAEFFSLVTGFRPLNSYVYHHLSRATVTPLRVKRRPSCVLCLSLIHI